MVYNSLLSDYSITNKEALKKSLDLTMSDETITIMTICTVQFFLNQNTTLSFIQKYATLMGLIFGVEFLRTYFNLRATTKKQIRHHQQQDPHWGRQPAGRLLLDV